MRCKSCGIEGAEFYQSNKSKCKECIKAAVLKNRLENIDRIRSYDRLRGSQPHRVAARLAYSKTDAYKSSHSASITKYRDDEPRRYTARNILNAAVRDKKITPLPCMLCGEKAEAHHPDYDRPLDVVWLCVQHHKQAHALAREYQRAA